MADITVRPPVQPLQPGAFSGIDASALVTRTGEGRPVVAVLGATTGGAPNKALYFSDPQALKNVLRSGAAFDCARFALDGGASQVCVVRAGAPLQSTKDLSATSGTGITLTAIDYGVWTNGISITVAANNLVTLTYVDPNGVTFTESWAVGSGKTAVEVAAAINGTAYGFTASQYVTATAGGGTMPLATASISVMTAGSDGASLDAAAWTAALVILETEDVQFVEVATGDATIHALAAAHNDAMSTTLARRERTSILGAVSGESVSAQVTRMASLRKARAQLVYPEVIDFNLAGVRTTYDPFYLAARIAGQHAALDDPAEALTHADIDVLDVAVTLSTIGGGAIDQLLAAGVSPAARKPGGNGGVWLVDSLSGWNTDDTFRDFHKVRSADEVARRARHALEDAFVGKKSLDNTAGNLAVVANAELDEMLTQGLIRRHLPATVGQGQTAKDYVVTLPVMLVDTTKFIYIAVALQPASLLRSPVAA